MKGFKTIAAAAALGAVSAVQGLDLAQIFPSDPQTQGWIMLGVATLFGALRVVTTGPVPLQKTSR